MIDYIYYVPKGTEAYLTDDFQTFDNYKTIKNQYFLELLIPEKLLSDYERNRSAIAQWIAEYKNGVIDKDKIAKAFVDFRTLQKNLIPKIAKSDHTGYFHFRDDIHGSPYILVIKKKDVSPIEVTDEMRRELKAGYDVSVSVRSSAPEVNQDVMYKELRIPFAEIMKRWKKRSKDEEFESLLNQFQKAWNVKSSHIHIPDSYSSQVLPIDQLSAARRVVNTYYKNSKKGGEV